MEATPGFEPGVEDLQSPALPLGYVASKKGHYILKPFLVKDISEILHGPMMRFATHFFCVSEPKRIVSS